VGGSLPTSLAATGHGLASLETVFEKIVLGDGTALLHGTDTGHMLDRLAWPHIVSSKPYLSCRPFIPLALSSGCFWNRCLFCPDRGVPFHKVPEATLARFLETIPEAILVKGPVIHLLDSALPPSLLRRFLPHVKAAGAGFFGFARPTAKLAEAGLLEEAAKSGCLMLQLGAEGGSKPLLDRYQKGIDPEEAKAVVTEAAAHGIRTYLYLLFGLPGETEKDLEMTLDMVSGAADSVDFLNLSLFNLPRFSELTTRAPELGIEIHDFPGEDGLIRLYWPFTANGVDSRKQARAFLKTRFKKDESIKEARLRTPRWLRAAHLALMQIPGRHRTTIYR
jgi:radical SAM superfamily enzyme YgiQ (UPF0313 family)